MSVNSERRLLLATVLFGLIGGAAPGVPIGPVNVFPYRALLLVASALAAVRLLQFRRPPVPLNQLARVYLVFLLFWVLWASASGAWALDPKVAYRQAALLMGGALQAALLACYLEEGRFLRVLFLVWVAFFAACTGVAVWESWTGLHLPVSGYGQPENVAYRFTPSGVFVNANDLALAVTVSVAIVLPWLRRTGSWTARIAGTTLVFAALYVLAKANSRAGFATMALVLSVWIVWFLRGRARLRIAVAVFILVGAIAVLAPGRSGPLLRHVGEQAGQLPALLEGRTQEHRLVLIADALEVAIQARGMGAGGGNAEVHLRSMAYRRDGLSNIHNWWLELLADYGLPVFTGYVMLYGLLFLRLWTASRRAADRWSRIWLEGMTLALMAFAIMSMAPSSVLGQPITWILPGIAVGLQNRVRRLAPALPASADPCTS